MIENNLLQRVKRLEEWRREIQKGMASGESTPLDMNVIKARGRARLARDLNPDFFVEEDD